jgi:homoserine dehydrogenase
MSRAPLRVAVLGAGTVGREVIRALLERADELRATDGASLVLAGIAVRDVERARARGLPADLLTDAPAHLVAAADTDVIVELMGGDEPGRTLIAAALAAGKSVVTANKHVIAHHGLELEGLARRTGSALRFEASVGGGVPVLGPIATELAGARLRAVRGIVNGTTNYILTAMAEEGRAYEEVLAAAKAAGYAEADPSGDVEGHDAVNKLVILARLAFGVWLDPGDVTNVGPDGPGAGRPGITGVTPGDLAAARAGNGVIKLIATAVREPTSGNDAGDLVAGERILASVLPTVVAADSAFGRTGGVLNRIELDDEALGTVAFSGPGAGGPATSIAVLGDLVAIGRDLGSTWAGLQPATAAAAR